MGKSHDQVMAAEEIPVISVSPFISTSTESSTATREARTQVAKAWNDAFRKLGFAYIVGHGVPSETIQNLYQDALNFFNQPLNEKLKFDLQEGYGEGGYCRIGSEAVGKTMMFNENDRDSNYLTSPPDLVESFEVLVSGEVPEEGASRSSFMPEGPSDLQKSLQTYWTHMDRLLNTIMEVSAVALGLKEDYFEPFHTHPYECLRLAYYPAQDKTRPLPGQFRYGPHTDYTGYTILWQDDAPGGLEVAGGKEGTWVPVKPKKGTFVVNTGDAIQQWTNDHWKANLHRVVNPPEDQSERHRLSIVFFTGSNMDVIIEPLSVCCSHDNPPKYPPICSRELLRSKIDISQTTGKL